MVNVLADLAIESEAATATALRLARAYDEENLNKLTRAGAHVAISPNVTGAIRMASALLRPSVVSFLDVTTRGTDIDLRLEEAPIPAESALAGQSLAQARIPQQTGLVVLAVRRAGGARRAHPGRNAHHGRGRRRGRPGRRRGRGARSRA